MCLITITFYFLGYLYSVDCFVGLLSSWIYLISLVGVAIEFVGVNNIFSFSALSNRTCFIALSSIKRILLFKRDQLKSQSVEDYLQAVAQMFLASNVPYCSQAEKKHMFAVC